MEQGRKGKTSRACYVQKVPAGREMPGNASVPTQDTRKTFVNRLAFDPKTHDGSLGDANERKDQRAE